MILHNGLSASELHGQIRQRKICFGGNRRLKIYGTLHCASGKKLNRLNRVFFATEQEAIELGYRPCGHCMRDNYKNWKMKQIDKEKEVQLNLLPKDGTVEYYGSIMPLEEADDYLVRLLNNIEWKNDEAVIFGRHLITKRKVAWYGDRSFEYTYSKVTRTALPWTKDLLELKGMIEEKTGEQFNSCLLNLYHTGEEGMAWHSDEERDLIKDGAIGSLSFGAERKFAFKHKGTKEVVSLKLEHGSLLVMKGTTQTHWQHRLPPTKLIKNPRVNLTFRTIIR